jgi:hypothetical protein
MLARFEKSAFQHEVEDQVFSRSVEHVEPRQKKKPPTFAGG